MLSKGCFKKQDGKTVSPQNKPPSDPPCVFLLKQICPPIFLEIESMIGMIKLNLVPSKHLFVLFSYTGPLLLKN